MGLNWCPVVVSWLGGLVPVFWLMELDFISLKGSRVSSSRFWGVRGLSMTLDSPPSFGSVRHVCFCSHVEVAPSAYPHCCQSPTCPLSFCWSFCTLVPPCSAGWYLLGGGLRGVFLSSPNLCSASQRLVWVSLHTLSLPSAPRDLCAFLWAPWACLWCCRGLCSLLSAPRANPLHLKVCVLFSWHLGPTFCAAGLLWTSWLPEPVVWSGPGCVSCLWAEKCSFSEFFPLGPPLCPTLQNSAVPPWSCLWGSFTVHRNFLLHDSLPS